LALGRSPTGDAVPLTQPFLGRLASRCRADVDLSTERIDAILLSSPSAAEGFVNRALFPPNERVSIIDPTTSAAAAAVGLPFRTVRGRSFEGATNCSPRRKR
jgi:uroporphyrinogen-III synthase